VLFNFLVHVLLPVSEGLLRLLLVGDVAHEHLRLEGLNHVLGLLHVSVGLLDSLSTSVILEVLLDCVNSSTFDFLIFESTDTVFLTLCSLGLHGVWPVLDSSLGCSLEVFANRVPLRFVTVLLGAQDLVADPVKFVKTNDSSSWLLGFSVSDSRDSPGVGGGGWLHTWSRT